MSTINNIDDLNNSNTKITTNQQIIDIINNPEFGWKKVTYDINKSRVKCKYFTDNKYDYILNFKNNQRKSVEDRIQYNLFDYKTGEPNQVPVTLTYIISNKGVTYGKINDALEFGASHMHLVNSSDQETIIGGELSVDFTNNKVQYNLLSGTFSLDIMKTMEESAKTDYENKIKKLVEKVLNIKKTEGDPELEIEYINEILLPSTKPNIGELRNICKLNSLELINGIITEEPTKRCTRNSLTRIEDIETREKYKIIKLDLSNSNIDYSYPNLTCHQYMDQEPVDKFLKQKIMGKIGDISGQMYNDINNINNTTAVLKALIPTLWISSPISRAISTGYFYSILSGYNQEYIAINDLWREQDFDFGMLIQANGGISVKTKSGKDEKYKWANFIRTDENNATCQLGKLPKNLPKSNKILHMFKTNFIDTIPDLSSNIIWLTGHGGTSKLYVQLFCNKKYEVINDSVSLSSNQDFTNLNFGETIIINKENCYILKKVSDIQYIKNHITDGKILLLTRHMQPNVLSWSRYWNEGDPTNIDFGDLNSKQYPGRPLYPRYINIEEIISDQTITEMEKPLTVSVLYGSANLNIVGL
jgi:hypothetical protein